MKRKRKILIDKIVTALRFKIYLCFLPFTLILLTSAPARAYRPQPGKISASTGPYIFSSDLQSKPDHFYEHSKLGWSLVAEAVLGQSSGLEIGLFYMDKPYLRFDGDDYLVESINRLYITTGYRYWWSDDISTALGIFSSFSMGDVENVFQTKVFSQDFLTSAHDVSEHGLDASIRFEYEISNKHGLVLDLRYSLNLNPQSGERINHYALNLGYIQRLEVK